ncbi:hypothetical protein RYR42_002574 [Edwardsiella piscicida]|nr:hypothetical protein [Edwardsiella piscicida]
MKAIEHSYKEMMHARLVASGYTPEEADKLVNHDQTDLTAVLKLNLAYSLSLYSLESSLRAIITSSRSTQADVVEAMKMLVELSARHEHLFKS